MNAQNEQLQQLLTNESDSENFKQKAMDLVKQGANSAVCSKSATQFSLLHILVRQNKNGANNKEISELASLNSVILQCKDGLGRAPLESLIDAFNNKLCSFDDFKQSAMALVRAGADITLESSYGTHDPLLHVLVRNNMQGVNNNEIKELILSKPAILDCKDSAGNTALQSLIYAYLNRICSFDDFKHSAMTFARAGVNITSLSTTLGTFSMLDELVRKNVADTNNDNEIAELARLYPKVLTCKDDKGRTALQSLIDDYNTGTCSGLYTFKRSAMALAKAGADVTLLSTYKHKPSLLHVLVDNINENAQEIDELIALNKNVVNIKNDQGFTPVHSCLVNNKNVTGDMLDKLVSETNLKLKDDQRGTTLLHVACRAGNLSAVQYLYTKNLSFNIRHSLTALTKSHQTLIHYAVLSGNKDLIQWLIDTMQIDINARDISGETALHYAAFYNNREVIELLTRNGADLTIQNDENQKAFNIALVKGHPELVSYLVNPEIEFFNTIQVMQEYGESLKEQGASKGQVAIDLAKKLTDKAQQFFKQEPAKRNVDQFKEEFSTLLHSKDHEMRAYRASWRTIVLNIAIALVSGLVLIAGKLIYSQVTQGRPLFFFQKNKTTSEQKITDIEQSLNNIDKSA